MNKTPTLKKYLIFFLKKRFFIFREMELISFLKKIFLIFQEETFEARKTKKNSL